MKKVRDYRKVDRLLKRDDMSLRQIADRTDTPFSTVAWRRRTLGIKKMHLQRWTDVQVKWLKALYSSIGDYELSLIFSEAYPKEKGWTLKHIEKKRSYLGLTRTKEQLQAIKRRNAGFGCWMVGIVHTWDIRGRAQAGEVRTWMGREFIKIGNRFELHNRIIWKQHNGPIPPAMNIVKKDPGGSFSDIHNLEMITDAELARRNALSRYPVELRQLVTTLNTLNRTINEKQNARP